MTVVMARRIEIELTSARDDGTWTWRAVGAREPRGVIDAKVLAQGARVGDVLRVEAEFGLDGIAVVAVLPPKERAAPRQPHRDRGLPPGGDRHDVAGLAWRSGRAGGERGPRGDEGRERGAGRRAEPGRRDGAPDRRGARRGPAEAGRGPVEARRGRPSGEPPARPEAPAARRPVQERPGQERPGQERPGRSRPARLVPGTAHRDALFETLPPEQRPIAEQLASGGLPAVRRALAEQQASARAEGRPAVGGDAIVALAEQLLPSVKEATWLDRAEAVSGRLDTVSLRDLRAAVTSAAARGDQGRELLRRLREALDERLSKLRTAWEHDISHALEEGRVLQALRLSARPPEPTARFPAALVQPLVDAAGASLSATTPVERWLALLEAAVASPVRRSIKPSGIPEDPTGSVRQAATLAAGRIPALAPLLGLAMPPPPRPVSPAAARRTPPPPRAATTASPRPSTAPGAPALAEAAAPSPAGPVGSGSPPSLAPAPEAPKLAPAPPVAGLGVAATEAAGTLAANEAAELVAEALAAVAADEAAEIVAETLETVAAVAPTETAPAPAAGAGETVATPPGDEPEASTADDGAGAAAADAGVGETPSAAPSGEPEASTADEVPPSAPQPDADDPGTDAASVSVEAERIAGEDAVGDQPVA